jgi:hypothetical protein
MSCAIIQVVQDGAAMLHKGTPSNVIPLHERAAELCSNYG